MNFQTMNEAEVTIEEERITMHAKDGTNLFNGVSGRWKETVFPYFYIKVQGDFMLQCKVKVDFKSVYDLGALVIYEEEDKWIKFAFENADTGEPAIVSVVTRGTSDDCNGEPIAEEEVWLKICRQENMFAMHYSIDGKKWKLARICRLELQNEVMAGVSVQCPTGDGCTAYFEQFELGKNPYKDIRNLK